MTMTPNRGLVLSLAGLAAFLFLWIEKDWTLAHVPFGLPYRAVYDGWGLLTAGLAFIVGLYFYLRR